MRRKLILIFVVFVVLLFVVGSFSGFWILRVRSIPSEHPIHQITEFDPISNKTKTGFISLHRQLRKRDFVSYTNPLTGGNVVISNVFEKNFRCEARCICEEIERRVAGIVAKTMFVVVGAISTVMAGKISAEYFKEICSPFCASKQKQEKKKGSTFERLGTVELDDCNIDDLDLFNMDHVETTSRFNFLCKGKCVKSPMRAREEVEKDCESFKMTHLMEVDVFTHDVEIAHYVALEKFQKLELTPYCHKLSRSALNIEGHADDDFECSGRDRFSVDKRYHNIDCEHAG